MYNSFLYYIQESKKLVDSPILDETALTTETDAHLPIDTWVRWINQAQQHLQNVVVQAFQDYLVGRETTTFTSGTNEYTIPTNAIKIRLVERTDLDPDMLMIPVDITKKFEHSGYNNYVTSAYDRNWYSFWGNNLHIRPTPNNSSATMQQWFIRRMADLSYGTATSATDTTIVLAAAPTFGKTSTQNNYYIGSRIYIVSGTNSGQAAVVTGYTASTRTVTVSSWPGGTPSGTIVYSFLTDLPAEHDAILPLRTAIVAKIKDNEDASQLSSLYNELLDGMIVGLEERQLQQPRHVNYIIDPYYD